MQASDTFQPNDQPFILAVFDGRDKRKATPILEALYQSGCRVLQDDASNADAQAREARATHLKEAALVVLFASRRSLALEGWCGAVTYCVGRGTPVIALQLDDAKGADGIQLQLSTVPSLRCADYRDAASLLAALKRTEGFTQSLMGDPPSPRKKNAWMRAAALALLGLTAVAAAIIFVNVQSSLARAKEAVAVTPPPGITFADPVVQAAVCAALDKEAGAPVYTQELAAVNDLKLTQAPSTLADIAMLTQLQTLRVTQDCGPLCVPLLADAAYTIVVEDAA